ncbi:MAG TPA: protein kinase [Ktedonosporobacter sp.]|nr:protein kinase [Ktedonosporobacter sp.]
MTDYIGQQVGNYRLLRLLGQGAFASVYLAEHRYLEIPTAIKMLHMRIEAETQESFLSEARTIAHLQHPHIVRVRDFGFQEQIPYLVMEYTPNGTLRSLHPRGTRVPLEQIVSYVKQIAAALDYAHTQRVIHRDVKPENILLGAQQEALLSDFGIAVVQRTAGSLSTQLLAGTPLYMAPEQIQGHPSAASDQYSLGIMVYEWLCGEPPFRGPYFAVLNQHLHQRPSSLCARLPQLHQAVEDAVFGALAKDQSQRFSSIEDFATVLEEACFATQTLPSFPISPPALSPAAHIPPNADATQPLRRVSQRSEHRPEQVALVAVRPIVSTRTNATLPGLSRAQTNRQALLRKVRAFWITGVLEHSLRGALLLSPGLQAQSNAVINPWRLVLQHPDATQGELPAGTRITEVYDRAAGELLILGAPGAGKTMLLLELARDLLARAEKDERYPIPIIFNLSTWAVRHQGLADWLIEELASKYQVPQKLGQALLAAEQIFPLLDGLDEVPPRERTACIEVINRYRQEHGLLPLVVCSRMADYLAQTARVQLGCAVAIQALTMQQIDSYLTHGGKPLQALRTALLQDAELLELARTPLMLNVLALAYQGQPLHAGVLTGSAAARQRSLFTTYVQRMLERRGTATDYTREQTIHWLTYLARQMKHHGQTVFYIERMQPDWLEDQWSRKRYPHLVYGLIFAFIGAFCLGPDGGKLFMPFPNMGGFLVAALSFALVCASCFGMLNGLIAGRPPVKKANGRIRWSWLRIGERLSRALLNGCLVGLLIGLPFGIAVLQQRVNQTLNTQTNVLIIGVLFSFLGGLLSLLIDGILGIQTTEIRPTETFVWSWVKMGQQCLKLVGLGLLSSLLLGLLVALSHGLSLWMTTETKTWQMMLQIALHVALQDGLPTAVQFGPFIVFIYGLLGAFTGGMSSNRLDERNLTKPNQGIRRSALHSVLIGTMSLLIGGIIGGLFVGGLFAIIAKQNKTSLDVVNLMLTYGLIFGPLAGFINGLRSGGIACIQHVALRWLLREAGSLPWNYARFLDYAAERVLLRKVGGGYIFIHRLLLEYFASL